jgi:hypothetical protein
VAELQLAPVAEVQLPHAPQLFGVGSPEQPAAQALALDTQQHRAYVGESSCGCGRPACWHSEHETAVV